MINIRKPSFVLLGNRKIAYDEVNPAQPRGTILLITGLASKRLAWYKQLDEFGRYYRTIAIDNRDVGDSDPTPAPYRITDQADDAAALLRALGVQRAFIVGISMGGFISLELALHYPQMVAKLVLVSTSGGGLTNVPSSPRLWPSLLRREKLEVGALACKTYTGIMGPGYAANHPIEMEDIATIARYHPMTQDAYSRQLRACLTHNAAGRLGQITAPTLVIHGDKDPLVPIANGRRLSHKIPEAKMLVYPGVGHIPIIERAEQFNRDVLSFLNA